MENKPVKKAVIIVQLVTLLFWVLFFVILLVLKTNSDICEEWTKGFARWYETTIGTLFKWIPFSLTEVVFLILIILSISLLVGMIVSFCKAKPLKAVSKLLSIAIIVMSVLTVYAATAEMAYNRHALPVTIYEEKVEKTDFRTINEYFIADLNKVTADLEFDEDGEVVSPYSLSEMNDLLEKEFERITNAYGDYFTPFTTRVKPMATSFIYRELHITGVTFMPTTEANINYLNVKALKPFTYAHEIFHTKGVMKEEDADFMALYLMLTSENSYFRYSGYYFSLSSLLYLASLTGVESDYKEVMALVNNNYKLDKQYGNRYWKEHNAFADFGDWWNDLYLKLSGEKEGTKSYNDTPTDVDEDTHEVIKFSLYQKLYFKLYYEANPVIE